MAKAPIEIRSFARQHTEAALNTLVDIMSNENSKDAARVAAAQAILDRGWGKPSQSMEVSGPEGGPIQHENLSDEAAARAMAHIFLAADKAKGKTRK